MDRTPESCFPARRAGSSALVMNPPGTTIVATVSHPTEASVIRSLLESYGVVCAFSSRIPHNIYPVSIEGVTHIHIYVPEALAPEATRILEEHRRPDSSLHLVEQDESAPTESDS